MNQKKIDLKIVTRVERARELSRTVLTLRDALRCVREAEGVCFLAFCFSAVT